MNEPDREIPRVEPARIDTGTMPTLDVRSHPGREQIRGALRYDAKSLLREAKLALPLTHDGPIVVYGDSDEAAAQVAARLREQGYANVAILSGGFDAYKEAGLAVEAITQEQPVPGTESGVPRL